MALPQPLDRAALQGSAIAAAMLQVREGVRLALEQVGVLDVEASAEKAIAALACIYAAM